MKIKNFNIIKLIDSPYKDEIREEDGEILYCETRYMRDRSSFAGMALRIINEKNVIIVKKCRERIIRNISKYEKLYIGYEQDYIDYIKYIFYSEKREYGLEINFLVYSDVRSSQVIFGELIENIDMYHKPVM